MNMKRNFLFFIVFTLIFSLSIMTSTAQKASKIIYVGDPMCSWCYGFSGELSKVLAEFGDELELEMVMGGLWPYNTQTMRDLSDFLHSHWKEVHERSGQPFAYDILADEDFVYDTEPACRAVRVIREIAPDQELAFFQAVQRAFYANNKNTHEVGTYLAIAKELGIDQTAFQAKFNTVEMKQAVKQDFSRAAQLGIRGFPSVVLQVGSNYFLVASGYSTAEKVIQRIKAQL